MTRRLLLFVALPVFALGALLISIAAWLVATESGLRWSWRVAQEFLPALSADAVEGRLASPLRLRGLRFESDAFRLIIDSAELRWSPAALKQRELAVRRLQLSGVRFTQLQAAPADEVEGEPFALPEQIDLPVSIALNDVIINDFAYQAQPDSRPFVIKHAALRAGFADNELDIDRLTASGPLFELSGQANIVARDDYASRVNLAWQLRPPDYAPLAGKTVVQGDLAEMQLTQTVDAPYSLVLDARLYDVVDELQFKTTLRVDNASLQAINATLPGVAISADANAGGTLSDLGLAADLSLATPDQGTIYAQLNGGFAGQVATVQKLLINAEDTPATLRAQGQIDLANEQPVLDLSVNWQQLQWPLQTAAAPQYASPSGNLNLTGTLQDYRLQAGAEVALVEDKPAQLRLQGSGSDQALTLQTIRLDALDGHIDGRAEMTWRPDLLASITLQGENLNPAILSTQWPGMLRLALAANIRQRDGQTVASLQRLAVTGDLRDQPVDLQAAGEWRDKKLQISKMKLRSGPSTVSATGAVGEKLALGFAVNSPDLGTLLPQASGKLHGSGRLKGTLPQPAITADIEGNNIRFGDYAVADLKLNGDVDLQRAGPSTLTLVAREAALPGVELEQVNIRGNGNSQQHRLSLTALSNVGNAQLELSGKLEDDVWSIQFNEAQLNYGDLDPWTLAAPQAAVIGADKQKLLPGCWRSGEAELCFEGERAAEKLQALANIKALPFAYFDQLMPSAINAQGRISGAAAISQQPGEQLHVSIDLETTASKLRKRGTATQPGDTLLAAQPASVAARYDADGLSARLDLPFVDKGGIQGQLSIPPDAAPLVQRPLQGDIEFAVADLGFIAALTPEIESAGGSIGGKLQLGGSLENPLPNGNLKLANGAIMLAAPGVEITDIGLQATADVAGKLKYSGGLNSGGGRLSLRGEGDLAGDAITASMTLAGEKFQVFNTEDARVYASPDLQIDVQQDRIAVSGEVRVPRAEITPQELPESAVAVSKDQVIIDAQTTPPGEAEQRELYAQVDLILGENVTLDGFGFKGGVTGELQVTQRPREPTIGSGELEIIDGEYRAYGQGLVIEQGRILFAGGPIDQPGISVRAVRRPAENILVGVRARGSLQQPDFTVFSEPGMSQSEQLSWLVLGRPLDNTSDAEGDMLTKAALALGIKGGNVLAKRLGEDLGVDNIGIETGSGEAGAASDVNQAAFVIGKYLSPRLYVSYGIGLFESISTVKLEYTINDHWKVSTESSTLSSGGDVTYTIER